MQRQRHHTVTFIASLSRCATWRINQKQPDQGAKWFVYLAHKQKNGSVWDEGAHDGKKNQETNKEIVQT